VEFVDAVDVVRSELTFADEDTTEDEADDARVLEALVAAVTETIELAAVMLLVLVGRGWLTWAVARAEKMGRRVRMSFMIGLLEGMCCKMVCQVDTRMLNFPWRSCQTARVTEFTVGKTGR
jgi:hypothetical protein